MPNRNEVYRANEMIDCGNIISSEGLCAGAENSPAAIVRNCYICCCFCPKNRRKFNKCEARCPEVPSQVRDYVLNVDRKGKRI